MLGLNCLECAIILKFAHKLIDKLLLLVVVVFVAAVAVAVCRLPFSICHLLATSFSP